MTVTQTFPPVPLTARSLYDSDPTFRAGINKWVADRRCPIEMGDFLDELGPTAQADCARWAATEPDRPTGIGNESICGPYPGQYIHNHWWYKTNPLLLARDVPGEHIRDHYRKSKNDSTTDAVLWLLDNWIPA